MKSLKILFLFLLAKAALFFLFRCRYTLEMKKSAEKKGGAKAGHNDGYTSSEMVENVETVSERKEENVKPLGHAKRKRATKTEIEKKEENDPKRAKATKLQEPEPEYFKENRILVCCFTHVLFYIPYLSLLIKFSQTLWLLYALQHVDGINAETSNGVLTRESEREDKRWYKESGGHSQRVCTRSYDLVRAWSRPRSPDPEREMSRSRIVAADEFSARGRHHESSRDCRHDRADSSRTEENHHRRRRYEEYDRQYSRQALEREYRDSEGRVFDKHLNQVPHFVWLSWISQLLFSLQRTVAPHVKLVLLKIAALFPQVINLPF